ncbi:MAG: VanZ family protein [Acidobacteria bacterium]|nr:VanZ family protein [Acidobacteriota bacterium]
MAFGFPITGWRARVYAYAPLFLWVGVILLLGSGPGSMTQTSRIIGPLLEFFFPSASPETRLFIHAFVRKSAHFVEYALLAVLAVRAFTSSNTGIRHYRFILALILVAVVASTDEINQSFQEARTSSPWDVLLDITGGLVALISYRIIRRKT